MLLFVDVFIKRTDIYIPEGKEPRHQMGRLKVDLQPEPKAEHGDRS